MDYTYNPAGQINDLTSQFHGPPFPRRTPALTCHNGSNDPMKPENPPNEHLDHHSESGDRGRLCDKTRLILKVRYVILLWIVCGTKPEIKVHLQMKPIVVYLVQKHPLQPPGTGPLFRWLHSDNALHKELEGLIGPFDEQDLEILVDEVPAGILWDRLLKELIDENVRMVVTHLAPLSPAQRQQLIGICAQTGAQLITPADAGRSR